MSFKHSMQNILRCTGSVERMLSRNAKPKKCSARCLAFRKKRMLSRSNTALRNQMILDSQSKSLSGQHLGAINVHPYNSIDIH